MKPKVVLVKEFDRHGRLVLPKEWREKYAQRGKVILRVENDRIVIEPYKLADLTEFFDSAEADIKSDLRDWKSLRRELSEVR